MYGPPPLRDGFMAQQSCYEAASLQIYPQIYPQVRVSFPQVCPPPVGASLSCCSQLADCDLGHVLPNAASNHWFPVANVGERF